VPSHYILLFLAEPLTPWAAWDWVQGQISSEGQEVACHALVKYLQAALTCSVEGAEIVLTLANPPMAPMADGLLLDHCQCMVHEDFLQLNQQLAGAQQDQVAATLGELVRDNCNARELDHSDREKAKSKDPQDFLGEARLQKLLHWSQVEMSLDLQAIWRDLANAKKSQQ